MKKILGITNIRADYDLLYGVYKNLDRDPDTDLRLLVGGAHLSPTYGTSVENIEEDGFTILAKIETLIDSNTPQSSLKTAAIFLQNAADIVAQYAPDAILYAGDREDVVMGGLLGAYLHIPTFHFYGGDHVVGGHVNNPVRHATSKLSTFHLVSLPSHKKRLMSMGEPEKRIFVTGSPALDRFDDHKNYDKSYFEEYFDLPFALDRYALVIFHPHDLERETGNRYFENILTSLEEMGYTSFVSYPNTDSGNKNIIEVIEKYRDKDSFIFYKNLNRDLFLSLFKKASFLIGNSSAGILEAASVPLPAINIGKRQLGREANKNVIFTDPDEQSIKKAIRKASSDAFKERIRGVKNIYGGENSSDKAAEIIKNYELDNMVYKTEDPLDHE